MDELKPLIVPEELREALAAEAVSEGVSLETITVQAVEPHLEALKTRKFFEDKARRADPEWLMNFLDREGGEPPVPATSCPRAMFVRADASAPDWPAESPHRTLSAFHCEA